MINCSVKYAVLEAEESRKKEVLFADAEFGK